MRFRLSDLATAVEGQLAGPDLSTAETPIDGSVSGVSIDSRTVSAGQLFVPIVAERDGHDFIDAAVSNGAAAYLTAKNPVGSAVASESPTPGLR